MNCVIRLDIVRNEMDEFRHDRLHTRWVTRRVSCFHEYTVKPLVIRADTQTLSRSPCGTTTVEYLQPILSKPARQVDYDSFDSSENSLEHDPVRRAKSFKGSPTNEAQRLLPIIGQGRPRKGHKRVPVCAYLGPEG